MKHNDFSAQFWNLFGIKYRIYDAKDILFTKRDKRADEKQFNTFLNNSSILSNEAWFKYKSLDVNNFDEICVNYIGLNDEKSTFSIYQIINVVHNYKFFQQLGLPTNYFINLFAFQVAYIIESMAFHNLDIVLFDNALSEKSLWGFIDYCKKTSNVASNKDFATELAYIYFDIKEGLNQKVQANLEEITYKKFETDLSKWKHNRAFPSFIKMIMLCSTLKNNTLNQDQHKAYIFQLFIARALLCLKKEHNIDDHIEKSFLRQYTAFRIELKKLFQQENYVDEINQLQNRYLIDFDTIYAKDQSYDEKYKLIQTACQYFLQMNPDEDHEKKLMSIFRSIDTTKIIALFNQKQYLELIELIETQQTQIRDFLIFEPFSALVLFITALKTEKTPLIKKYEKAFDRTFGGLLLLAKKQALNNGYSRYELMETLKNTTQLEHCFIAFKSYFNNFQL